SLIVWDVRTGEPTREVKLENGNSQLCPRLILASSDCVICDYGNELRIVRFPLTADKAKAFLHGELKRTHSGIKIGLLEHLLRKCLPHIFREEIANASLNVFLAHCKNIPNYLLDEIKGKLCLRYLKWYECHNSHIDIWLRNKCPTRYDEFEMRCRPYLRHHRQSTSLGIEKGCHNSLTNFLLESQSHTCTSISPSTPLEAYILQPIDEETC
uniref:Uncharacterized protein n=1 Tax=Lutzomyia longipalpis TaxID=7200 RepID=A0A1B0CTH2_LUTLO